MRTTRVEQVAATTRFLSDHLLDHHPIIDILTQAQELRPIINFDPVLSLPVLSLLMQSSPFSAELAAEFTEDHGILDSE